MPHAQRKNTCVQVFAASTVIAIDLVWMFSPGLLRPSVNKPASHPSPFSASICKHIIPHLPMHQPPSSMMRLTLVFPIHCPARQGVNGRDSDPVLIGLGYTHSSQTVLCLSLGWLFRLLKEASGHVCEHALSRYPTAAG